MTQKLTEDALVKQLIADPAEIPDLKIRVGWLGRSARQGKWRLYINAELTTYLEFGEKEVLHVVPLKSDINPFGGSIVYLDRQAELTYTRTSSAERQAEWIGGDITTEYWRKAAARGLVFNPGVGPQPFNPLWTIGILTTVIIIAATTYAISEVADCPNPNNSAGLCPTSLSACC